MNNYWYFLVIIFTSLGLQAAGLSLPQKIDELQKKLADINQEAEQNCHLSFEEIGSRGQNINRKKLLCLSQYKQKFRGYLEELYSLKQQYFKEYFQEFEENLRISHNKDLINLDEKFRKVE